MRCIRRIPLAVKDPQAKSLPAIVKATQLARAPLPRLIPS